MKPTAVWFGLGLLLLAPPARAVEVYPLDQLQPGMRGTTRTVLQGTRIEEIQTEILGVQKSALGPGRDLIIGRLIDPRTEKTGAVHGMSGSPLYIDGKLVGALSRRITLFEKDGHCGFTPAADMFDVERRREGATPSPWESGTWVGTHDLGSLGMGGSMAAFGQALGVPWAIPGWSPAMERALQPFLSQIPGFIPVAAPSGTAPADKKLPLENGSPVAVVLADGDFALSGTGTLTWTDGERFMAFGHPMMGLGETRLPVAPAEIITTIPSYLRPHKLANVGTACGTMTQDRLSAISGKFGAVPEMGTYRINRSHNGELRPEFKGRMARHPLMTPTLVAVMMIQAVADEQDSSEHFTMRMHGRVRFRGLDPLLIDGLYSGPDEERISAVVDQIQPLMLMSRLFPRQVEIEALELSVQSFERDSVWEITEVKADRSLVRPGGVVRLSTRLKNPTGAERWVEQDLAVPEEVRGGTVELRVSGGGELRREAVAERQSGSPEHPAEWLRALNVNFYSDRLYAQINLTEPGAASSGYLQSGLPGSIARHQAAAATIRSVRRTVASVDEPMKGVVSGSARISLKVKP